MDLVLVYDDVHSGRRRCRHLAGTMLIGAAHEPPNVFLEGPGVAPDHAEIVCEGGRPPWIRLRNHDAALFVNHRLTPTAELSAGDVVHVGDVRLDVLGEPGKPVAVADPTTPSENVRFSRLQLALVALVCAAILAITGAQIVPDVAKRFSAATSEADTPMTEAEAIRAVLPSVVTIVTGKGRGEGIGSGVFVTDMGHVLTCNHVVANARQVMVKVHGGRRVKAKVLATRQLTDLALLKIADIEPSFPIEFADDDEVTPGQTVYAIGSPLDEEFELSVTRGIVSGADRKLRGVTFIQHDAAINPGNSGGPLVTGEGRLAGINSFKIVADRGVVSGINFAVSMRHVRTFLNDVRETR
jgi:hypothetical protein